MKFPLLRATLFLVISTSLLQAAVTRVEPSNWWAAMSNPSLQVLLYGENISALTPEIDYPGVDVETVVRVENQNYLFVYLEIDKSVRPGDFEILLTSGGKLIESVPYSIWPRERASRERMGFDPSDTIYLITPDRFANGNPANDEFPGMAEGLERSHKDGRHGGDIQGIADSMDYIEDMGFTAIWVNPVLENDMKRAYHGYATTDFYKVDPRYGTNGEYKALIKMANDRGIKVIMDMILNHSGSAHWFVKDPPTSDWINFGGEYVNTSHRRQTNQDRYASEFDRKKHADGWFVSAMPDLNQRNSLMADYLIQNTIWWIEYSGLDGIRMDTYPYPDKDFMSRWTREVMAEYPNFNIVGEEWSLDVPIVAYWQRGKVNQDGYVSDLPSLMDFPLQHALVNGLTDKSRNSYDPQLIQLYEALALDFVYADPSNLVIFPDNHDMARFFTQVNEDFDLFKMGIIYTLTMRGIPQIYYGTEILMDSSENPGDHGLIRSDFPGGWQGDKVNAFTGNGLRPNQVQAQEFMRKLLTWRKDKAVIHTGKLMHFAPENGVYTYFRYNGEECVMVVLNLAEQMVSPPMEKYAERTNGYTMGIDVVTGKGYELDNLSVPPKSALILELN